MEEIYRAALRPGGRRGHHCHRHPANVIHYQEVFKAGFRVSIDRSGLLGHAIEVLLFRSVRLGQRGGNEEEIALVCLWEASALKNSFWGQS
jgi:hypothetical protein